MRKDEFLKQLEYLLSDISEEERQEAIEFYRCYFEDAGEGSEERLISELGSPEKVAYMIRSGLNQGDEEGVYTESGYRKGQWEQEHPLTKREDILSEEQEESQYSAGQEHESREEPFEYGEEHHGYGEEPFEYREEHRGDTANDVLRVLAFPLRVIFIIVGVVILCAVMVALVAVAVGFVATMGGLFIAGFCALAFGVFGIIGGVAGLIAAWAGGFLILALAVLMLIVVVLYCGKFLPWSLRALAKGIRNLCGTGRKNRRD